MTGEVCLASLSHDASTALVFSSPPTSLVAGLQELRSGARRAQATPPPASSVDSRADSIPIASRGQRLSSIYLSLTGAASDREPSAAPLGAAPPTERCSAFRGPVVGAWDCVAGGRLAEPAVVPAEVATMSQTTSATTGRRYGLDLDVTEAAPNHSTAVSDASADRCGDARSRVHVGSRAAVGSGSGRPLERRVRGLARVQGWEPFRGPRAGRARARHHARSATGASAPASACSKTVGVDATTLEANAAMRSIERRDTGVAQTCVQETGAVHRAADRKMLCISRACRRSVGLRGGWPTR